MWLPRYDVNFLIHIYLRIYLRKRKIMSTTLQKFRRRLLNLILEVSHVSELWNYNYREKMHLNFLCICTLVLLAVISAFSVSKTVSKSVNFLSRSTSPHSVWMSETHIHPFLNMFSCGNALTHTHILCKRLWIEKTGTATVFISAAFQLGEGKESWSALTIN